MQRSNFLIHLVNGQLTIDVSPENSMPGIVRFEPFQTNGGQRIVDCSLPFGAFLLADHEDLYPFILQEFRDLRGQLFERHLARIIEPHNTRLID